MAAGILKNLLDGINIEDFPAGGANDAEYAALDTTALIQAIEGSKELAVDAALAGRRPVVSMQAAAQFLARGDLGALKAYVYARGRRFVSNASNQEVTTYVGRLTQAGRSINAQDAADIVIGATAQRDGLTVITNDVGFTKALKAIGAS